MKKFQNLRKKQGLSIAVTIIAASMSMVGLSSCVISGDSPNVTTTDYTVTEQESTAPETTQETTTAMTTTVDEYADAESVYVGMLMRFPKEWDGKKVFVYIDSPYINSDGVEKSNTKETEIDFKAALGEEDIEKYRYESAELLVVRGIVQSGEKDVVLKEAKVVNLIKESSEAEKQLSSYIAAYNDASAKQDKLDEAAFKKSAVSVTWDKLRKYPDTYKGKAIKMKLKLTKVDPDGLIFEGDKIGVYPGTKHEVTLSDQRVPQEPRYAKGDTVVFYGIADGLSVIKVKNGTGLFAKTIKEYEVPKVIVKYNAK